MHDNLDRANWFERNLERIPEGSMLRWVFRAMLVGTLAVLGLDLYANIQHEQAGEWPGSTRLEPVTMEPAGTDDHIRPYLPRTRPVRRGGGKVTLPGYDTPPAHSALNRRMIFRLGEDGAMSAVGRIEPGTGGEFRQFVIKHQKGLKLVALHSPGGSVRDALAMAAVIREKKLETGVPNNAYCASSCPLAYAGGLKRHAGQRSWVGVHQVYTIPSALGSIHDGMAEAQRISARSQQHLVDMGVDPQVWIHAMRTPKDKLYIFTPKQLSEYKLATDVVPPPEKPRRHRKRRNTAAARG